MFKYYKKSFIMSFKSELEGNGDGAKIYKMVEDAKKDGVIEDKEVTAIKIEYSKERDSLKNDVKIKLTKLIAELKKEITKPVKKEKIEKKEKSNGLSDEVNNFINSSNGALKVDVGIVTYNLGNSEKSFVIKENPDMSKNVGNDNDEPKANPKHAHTLIQWMKSVNPNYGQAEQQVTAQTVEEQPSVVQTVENTLPALPQEQADDQIEKQEELQEKQQEEIEEREEKDEDANEKFIEDIEIELGNTRLKPEKLIGTSYKLATPGQKRWLDTFSTGKFFQLGEDDVTNGIRFDDVEVDLKNKTIKFSLDDDGITEDFNENIEIKMESMKRKGGEIFDKAIFLEKLQKKINEDIIPKMPKEE